MSRRGSSPMYSDSEGVSLQCYTNQTVCYCEALMSHPLVMDHCKGQDPIFGPCLSLLWPLKIIKDLSQVCCQKTICSVPLGEPTNRLWWKFCVVFNWREDSRIWNKKTFASLQWGGNCNAGIQGAKWPAPLCIWNNPQWIYMSGWAWRRDKEFCSKMWSLHRPLSMAQVLHRDDNMQPPNKLTLLPSSQSSGICAP